MDKEQIRNKIYRHKMIEEIKEDIIKEYYSIIRELSLEEIEKIYNDRKLDKPSLPSYNG